MNDEKWKRLLEAPAQKNEGACDPEGNPPMLAKLQASKPGRVLDIGCGVNPWTRQLKGFTSVEADLNINGIDMHELPDEWTDSFDYVYASHVFEHALIPGLVAREFARVLKTGGKLFLLQPQATETWTCKPEHTIILDARQMQWLFEKSGFVLIEAAENAGNNCAAFIFQKL